jgi:hypothetical protein
MQVTESQATTRSSRLQRMIRIYQSGQVSDFMDRVLDKVFAQEAAKEKALIDQLRIDLDEFEEQYGQDSETFYARFRAGEMGDTMDFMEWASLYDMYTGALARFSMLMD